MTQEEKIINQAKMFLNGMPKTEIVKLHNIGERTLINNITVLLKDIDPKLHLNVLVHFNLLTPQKVSREEVEQAKKDILDKNKNASDLNELNDLSIDAQNLDHLFPSEEKKYKFLVKCILTFRISLQSLSFLLRMDENVLYKNLLAYAPNLKMSLQYLFSYEQPNNRLGASKFIIFYESLVEASRNKDKEKLNFLMEMISDHKAQELAKKRQSQIHFTEEDYETMLEYLFKYSTTINQIAKMFNADQFYLKQILQDYLQNDPVRLNRLDNLLCTWEHWHSKRG